MKPTSIIFLIISIVLVIAGFAVAGVAKQIGAAEGIDLSVAVDEGADAAPFKYEYGDDEIGKIKIDVKDANVNVFGGAEKAYIELINFTEGMYEFSPGNRVLEVSEGVDITSLSGIASLAMNFKGLRSIISYYNMKNLEKTVNVYICDTAPVNVVEISLDFGDVKISDITASTDYSIDIDVGNVIVSNISTTSAVNVDVGRGDVTVDGCIIGQMKLGVDEGDTMISAKIERLDANVDSGDFYLDYADHLEHVDLKLYAIVGGITLDGEKIAGFMETGRPELPSSIAVSVSTGNIVIASNS